MPRRATRQQIERAWANDPTRLNEAQLRLLGFQRWDKSGLMLIPLTHLGCIPDGTVLHCINGNKYVVGKDEIDDDTRGGILAYGIFPRTVTHDSKGDIVSSSGVYTKRTGYFGGSRKKGEEE